MFRVSHPMRSRPAWLLLLLFLCPCLAGEAQGVVVPLSSEDVVRRFSSEEGLPQNSVNAIVQDRDGYLWLGTFGGLARFDGSSFALYRGAQGDGLSSERILSLWIDPQERLWIGTENAGLDVLVDGRFKHVPVCGTGCIVDQLLPAGQDVLLVNTDQGAYLVDLHTLEYERVPGVVLKRRHAVIGGDGGTYLADSSGLLRLEGRHVQRSPWPGEMDAGRIAWIATRGEEIWVALDGEIHRYSMSTRKWQPETYANPAEGKVAMWRDFRSQQWLSGPDGTLYREEKAGRWVAFPDRSFGRVESSLLDRDGSLWLGTAQNGLIHLAPSRVELLDDAGQGFDQPGMPVAGDGNGGQWLGLVCDGLRHRDHDGQVRKVSLDFHGSFGCPWSLHVEPDGSLWVGTVDGGVLLLTASGEIAERTVLAERVAVRAIHPAPEGGYYVAADRSMFLARRDPAGGIGLELLPALEGQAIAWIGPAAEGGVWMVGDQGVLRFQQGRIMQHMGMAEGLSTRYTRALLEEPDGVLWIGTYGGGLNYVKDGKVRHFTRANGLFDDVVSCLLKDESGNLWTSGNRGVAVLPAGELQRARDGGFPEAIGVSAADGLIPSETNGGVGSACHRDERGGLWFPLLTGFARIDPARILNVAPPSLRPSIESVSVGGQRQSTVDVLRLSPGARNLEIGFGAPELSAPEKLRFRFRLGSDAAWTDVATRRSVLYPILPWGEYDFEVEVRNAGGVWSEQSARLQIVHPQPWYLLPLVWVLASLAVPPLIFAGIHALRALVRRRKAHEAELVRQRTLELEYANEVLAREVMIDPKTGIANHRRLVEATELALETCRMERKPLTLLLFDIDDFKRYNDHYGHLAGDECLHHIAETVQAATSREHVLARFGGEEFALLMPNVDLAAAKAMAERLRVQVAAMTIAHAPGSAHPMVTVSVGGVTCDPVAMPSREALLGAADRAMYAAKLSGRNATVTRAFSAEADVIKPDLNKPDASKPDASRAGVSKSDAGKPDEAE